jgi:hypothetical protein
MATFMASTVTTINSLSISIQHVVASLCRAKALSAALRLMLY